MVEEKALPDLEWLSTELEALSDDLSWCVRHKYEGPALEDTIRLIFDTVDEARERLGESKK